MGARYYQAGKGRFTQADPRGSSIFEAQRYSYAVGANPVNATDPSGMTTCRMRSARRTGTLPLRGSAYAWFAVYFRQCWNGTHSWLAGGVSSDGWVQWPFWWESTYGGDKGVVVGDRGWRYGAHWYVFRARYGYTVPWPYQYTGYTHLDVWGGLYPNGRCVYGGEVCR